MYSITHEGEGIEHVAILRNAQFGTEVRVAVGYGFNAFSFKIPVESGIADILYAEEGFPKAGMRATSSGTPILVPFPNRIEGGKFTYDGKGYSLPLNSQGVNAIHGFAFDKPWRIIEEKVDETQASITAEFEMLRDSEFTEDHWPGNFRVRCRIGLYGKWASQKFSVKNLSSVRIPFGLGTHPYFRVPMVGDGVPDRCSIDVQADTQVVLDKTIPTGETKPVEESSDLRNSVEIRERSFDDVYTGIGKLGDVHLHGVVDPDAGCSLSLVHDENFKYVVVYIPPHRKAVCIEPYTCVTNAVNLGDSLGADGPPTGLWHLAPGEVREASIQMIPLAYPPKGVAKQ